MSIAEEITVYAQICVEPFEHGGQAHARVVVQHERKGCRWSVAYPGVPTSEMPWSQVAADVHEHATTGCPHAPREATT